MKKVDQKNEDHWGATTQTISIIQKRDTSSITQNLVKEWNKFVHSGKPRLKRDNYGSHVWSTKRPNSAGKKRVVEINVKLMNRAKWQETDQQNWRIATAAKRIKYEIPVTTGRFEYRRKNRKCESNFPVRLYYRGRQKNTVCRKQTICNTFKKTETSKPQHSF